MTFIDNTENIFIIVVAILFIYILVVFINRIGKLYNNTIIEGNTPVPTINPLCNAIPPLNPVQLPTNSVPNQNVENTLLSGYMSQLNTMITQLEYIQQTIPQIIPTIVVVNDVSSSQYVVTISDETIWPTAQTASTSQTTSTSNSTPNPSTPSSNQGYLAIPLSMFAYQQTITITVPTNGAIGATGPIGEPGLNGPIGPTGPVGPNGPKGTPISYNP